MIKKMSLAAALMLIGCGRERVVELPGARNPVTVQADANGGNDAVSEPDALSVPEIDGGHFVVDAEVVELPDAASCIGDHEPCGNGVACCTGFCSDELSSYTEGVCYPPQEDGAFCMQDTHCASGTCDQNVCVRQCSPVGEFCYGPEVPCCEGLVCTLVPDSYGQGHCVEKVPAGAFCQQNEECAGGSCVNNVCE